MASDFRRSVSLPFVIVSVAALGCSGLKSARAAEVPHKYALLVGVTEYPANPDRALEGGKSDVVLIRQVLRERFGFADTDMVTLVAANPPESQPTHKNIIGRLNDLAQKARKGDQIVIFMSGHGSRAPRALRAEDKNPEALTGLFLPQDIGVWNEAVQKVDRAIEDTDLSRELGAILDQGAFVWLIIDACHSGGMVREKGRGIDDHTERARDLAATELGVPEKLMEKAVAAELKHAEQSRGGAETPDSGFRPAIDHPNLAAIYACRSFERTVERKFPVDKPQDPPYGLLTYTLCNVLSESKSPLTYAELIRRINYKYQWRPTGQPVALVEGKARDRFILGDGGGRTSAIRIGHQGDAIRINAGLLHGLNPGSVLAVYPPPGSGSDDKILGHVRVEHSAAVWAKVVPCEYAGVAVPDPAKLLDECVARVVFTDFGINPLSVSIAWGKSERAATKNPDAPEIKRIRQALDDWAREMKLVQLVDDKGPADWRIELSKAPGAVRVRLQSALSPVSFAPPESATDSLAWLKETLRKIARAKALLEVAGRSASAADEPGRPHVQFKLIVTRQGAKDPIEMEWPGKGIVLHPGDKVLFEMVNKGTASVDVSLLFIDAAYGVAQIYPRPEVAFENRVAPGAVRRYQDVISGDPLGVERVVLIAVPAQGQTPADFSFLTESGIDRARTRSGDGRLNSPLGKLLLFSQFPDQAGLSRGLGGGDYDQFNVKIITWETAAASTPK